MRRVILVLAAMLADGGFAAGVLDAGARYEPAAHPAQQSQDGVRLWAELAPEWSQRSIVRARLEVKQDGASEVLEQDFTLRLTVASVGEEAGEDEGDEAGGDEQKRSTLLRASIERMSATYAARGDTITFEWPEVDEPGDPGDVSPPFSRIGRALAESVLEFEIGENGRARFVGGLESALLAVEEADGVEGDAGAAVRFLGVLAPGAIDRLVTSMITIDPERQPRGTGDTWRTHFQAKALGRDAEIVTENTLREVGDHTASIEGDIKLALGGGDGPTGTPRAAIAEQSGKLQARWDLHQRRLVSHLWETTAVWRMSLATEPPITTETTSTARIEITRPDVPPPAP